MLYVCLVLAEAIDNDLENTVRRLNDHAQDQGLDAIYMEPLEEDSGEHGANVVRLVNQEDGLFFFQVV